MQLPTALALALMLQSPVADGERTAIFQAAGFTPVGGQYQTCDRSGALEVDVRDLNGDGRPEAIVTDSGIECYGAAGAGFALLTRSAEGRWRKLYQSPGMLTVLESRAEGWPELEVGGPGFCFPVLRWNGREYSVARHAYEGRPCRG